MKWIGRVWDYLTSPLPTSRGVMICLCFWALHGVWREHKLNAELAETHEQVRACITQRSDQMATFWEACRVIELRVPPGSEGPWVDPAERCRDIAERFYCGHAK